MIQGRVGYLEWMAIRAVGTWRRSYSFNLIMDETMVLGIIKTSVSNVRIY